MAGSISRRYLKRKKHFEAYFKWTEQTTATEMVSEVLEQPQKDVFTNDRLRALGRKVVLLKQSVGKILAGKQRSVTSLAWKEQTFYHKGHVPRRCCSASL